MTGPAQADVDALRDLLDMIETFRDNDQKARYLLSSNWLRERGAAAAAHAQRRGVDQFGRALDGTAVVR